MGLDHIAKHSNPDWLPKILHRRRKAMLHIFLKLARHQVRTLDQLRSMNGKVRQEIVALHRPSLEVEIQEKHRYIRIGLHLLEGVLSAPSPGQARAAQHSGHGAPYTCIVFHQ